MGERNPEISVRSVFTDVSNPRCITLLHCRDNGEDIIVFGVSDCQLGHYGLLELAQDDDFTESSLSENAEVLGGELLDYQTLRKIRGSHAFGEIDDKILDQFIDKLEARRNRR